MSRWRWHNKWELVTKEMKCEGNMSDRKSHQTQRRSKRKQKTPKTPSKNEELLSLTSSIIEDLASRLSHTAKISALLSEDDQPISYQPVVAFLGAGISVHLTKGVPDVPEGWSMRWSQLVKELEKLLSTSLEKTVYRDLRENNGDEYEHRLWYLRTLLGSRFTAKLRALFNFDDEAIASIKAQRATEWGLLVDFLANCDGVITTNYDPLLEHLLRDTEARTGKWRDYVKSSSEPIPVAFIGDLENVYREGSAKPFLYLHGFYSNSPNVSDEDNCDGLVLTRSSYVRAYTGYSQVQAGHATRADTLQFILTRCTVVFIGYSISDYIIEATLIASTNPADSIKVDWSILTDATHYFIGGMRSASGGQLRVSYPPLAYLTHVSQLYNLKPILMEVVLQTHRYRGAKKIRRKALTFKDGLDEVLIRLRSKASQRSQDAERQVYKDILDE